MHRKQVRARSQGGWTSAVATARVCLTLFSRSPALTHGRRSLTETTGLNESLAPAAVAAATAAVSVRSDDRFACRPGSRGLR